MLKWYTKVGLHSQSSDRLLLRPFRSPTSNLQYQMGDGKIEGCMFRTVEWILKQLLPFFQISSALEASQCSGIMFSWPESIHGFCRESFLDSLHWCEVCPSPDALPFQVLFKRWVVPHVGYIYMLSLQIISRVLFSFGKNTGSWLPLIAFVLKACFLFMQLYHIPKSIVVSSLQFHSCTPGDFIVSDTKSTFHCNSLLCGCPLCLYFPQIFVVIGHKSLSSEIVHRVYGKLLTEGFPEPHSQNYSYNCDVVLEFQNHSATCRNFSRRYYRCCKIYTIWIWKVCIVSVCCPRVTLGACFLPKTEIKQLV